MRRLALPPTLLLMMTAAGCPTLKPTHPVTRAQEPRCALPSASDLGAGLSDEDDGGAPACMTGEPAAARPLPNVSKPEVLGVLVGPAAVHPLGDLHLYGTDLGFAFEHDHRLFVMFGDSLPTPDDICNEMHNDDTLATLPGRFDGRVPKVTFRTQPDSPKDFSPVRLLRGSRSLALGFGKAPTTAFSDGRHIYAIFDRLELTRCGEPADEGGATCPTDDHFICSHNVGECDPSYSGVVPPLCDLTQKTGCFPGQQCVAARVPLCVDTTSSQYDCTTAGQIAATAEDTELGVQRSDDPDVFDSVLVWPTNKFINVTARTITRLSSHKGCSDYRPGHGELLVWGRPRFAGEGGREARLYLMAHALPLQLDDAGKLRFAPRYFAGIDPGSGEPTWSPLQSQAQPLAMDGTAGGDPHEPLHIVNHSTLSWLGPPIEKWVMLYGGGLSDYLLLDPASAQYKAAPGAIMLRFADDPWGPFSPPQPLLAPGDPTRKGAPYGPGGFLYNAACTDTPGARCSVPDARISKHNDVVPSCLAGLILWDAGRLYGASIIDPYTAPNWDGGLDVIWNVSTWNPYSVVLMKTSFAPGAPAGR